ncbi:HAUS augmin-like complex subunit 7 [Liolophura sinensis]|uniref:HAUS augmin-like complex subunit 7 n=1 Tax=Liolophura sinensis TaxID=3198878 RepID=UPI0031589705
MAATSKETKECKMSKSFKKRLDMLECPYTSDVDESWISQLLLKPGESRIRILHWLFSRFDQAVSDVLDAQYSSVTTHVDSRLQRLLQVASALGLCSYDDIDLVRGVTTGPKQWLFLDQLLDIVSIADSAEDPQTKSFSVPGVVSDSWSLEEQFTQDSVYLERLVTQERMTTLFHPAITLLPPDLAHKLERSWVERGFTKDKPPLPDVKQLSESYSDLMGQLTRQREILQELLEELPQKEDQNSDLNHVSTTLGLMLKELGQFITGFTYSFENEIRPWCNKPQPHLTPLGPAVKRVHSLLSGLKEWILPWQLLRNFRIM